MLTTPAKCRDAWQSFQDPQALGKSVLFLEGTSRHLSPAEQEGHSPLGVKGGEGAVKEVSGL